MRLLKKSFITLFGGALVTLGLLFIVIPGPSLLFMLPGLFCLSYEYPLAKVWLRKCMKLTQASARWLDQKLRNQKYH